MKNLKVTQMPHISEKTFLQTQQSRNTPCLVQESVGTKRDKYGICNTVMGTDAHLRCERKQRVDKFLRERKQSYEKVVFNLIIICGHQCIGIFRAEKEKAK